MSNASTAPPGTKHYLSVSEIADYLGQTNDTVRGWLSRDLFPDPDAVFGSPERGNVSLWDRDRVIALIVDDGKGAKSKAERGDVADYAWNVEPERYITSYGIAALLRVSPNTVKWWLLDGAQRRTQGEKKRRTGRIGKPKQLITLPPPDATSAWVSGWKAETIWNWWNNDHPRMVGEDRNRQRSVVYTDLLDGSQVAVVDHRPDASLQVRAENPGERVDHVAASTVLANARGRRTKGFPDRRRTTGSWFVPDLSSLEVDDQQTVVQHLATLPRPSVVLAESPETLPEGVDGDPSVTVIGQSALDALLHAEHHEATN